MKTDKETYYFSRIVLLQPIMVLGFLGIILVYLLFIEPDIITKIILLTVLIFSLFILTPRSFKIIYYYLINRPAIIISDIYLIDNINSQKYNWTDIFDISYQSKLKRININIGDINRKKYLITRKGFSKLILKMNLNITHGIFWIPSKVINCNTIELTDNLNNYLKLTNKRQENNT